MVTGHCENVHQLSNCVPGFELIDPGPPSVVHTAIHYPVQNNLLNTTGNVRGCFHDVRCG